MPDLDVLTVFLHEKAIGTLARLPNERSLFTFTQEYIDTINRPTLSLSFKDTYGALITDSQPTKVRVPPFFSNLLPEGPLRRYLAKQVGVNEAREFFLLWALGHDLPGAITLQASETETDPWPMTTGIPNATKSIIAHTALRFSLAGVQLKLSAVMETTGGLTVPAHGVGGQWILKLPSAHFAGVPENEYSMMTLAKMLEMDIPEVKLMSLKECEGLPTDMDIPNGKALAIRRFDRTTDNELVHIEDFAQIFSVYPEDKYTRASYKNIAEVLWAEAGEESAIEFVRRLVFNALIGNADMHLKNWSLIYRDGIKPTLSPGYDFLSTIPYINDDQMALNLVKSKNMYAFSLATLTHFANKAKLPEELVIKTAKHTTQHFLQIWSTEKKHLALSSAVIKAVEKHFRRITLVEELV